MKQLYLLACVQALTVKDVQNQSGLKYLYNATADLNGFVSLKSNGVVNDTMYVNGTELYEYAGQAIDVDNDYEYQLCRCDAINFQGTSGQHFCNYRNPLDRFIPHEVQFRFQQFIWNADSYADTIATLQFITSVVDLWHGWKGNDNSETEEGGDREDIVAVADKGYMRMINGDNADNMSDSCLKKLQDQVGGKVGLPSGAICCYVNAEDGKRSWTFAYGQDFDSVAGITCNSYKVEEKEYVNSC